MKKIGTVLLMAFFGIACTSNPEDAIAAANQKLPSTKLSLTARLGGVSYKNNNRIVYIAASIHNPTADTIHFISMSCSFEDFFFTVGNPHYEIKPRYDCYSNFPITVVLPPHQSTDRFLMIEHDDSDEALHTGTVQIGMNFLDGGIHGEALEVYETSRMTGDTLLSQPIELDRVYPSTTY